MRKASLKRLYRVVHTLEDGRRLYLSTGGMIMVMARPEAEFWLQIAHFAHSITIDELVYSNDLKLYGHRSYFLERLQPFVRIVKSTWERADRELVPNAFVIGGLPADEVEQEYRPQEGYLRTIVVYD